MEGRERRWERAEKGERRRWESVEGYGKRGQGVQRTEREENEAYLLKHHVMESTEKNTPHSPALYPTRYPHPG